jgi:nucleoside-diphosphate-sugar epimerase
MRVFLTGATGFVGSHVASLLARKGHEVHALVMEGDSEERAFQERLGGVPVGRVRGDLLQPASYAAALEALRPDACIHAAWYANPKDYLSARVNLDLLWASAALGAKLADLGCRRLVGVGTCFEYDTKGGYLSESSPLGPEHLYSTCKRALFDVLTRLLADTQTEFAWTRLFFLYGPHESPGRLVPAVVRALLSGEEARVTKGTQIRDFLHVADAASGIVHVLESDLAGAVNVASGRPVRVAEVVETIARLLGKTDRVAWGAVEPRPNDPAFVCAGVAKLAASGWEPSLDLEAGLRSAIAWTRKTRDAREQIEES